MQLVGVFPRLGRLRAQPQKIPLEAVFLPRCKKGNRGFVLVFVVLDQINDRDLYDERYVLATFPSHRGPASRLFSWHDWKPARCG